MNSEDQNSIDGLAAYGQTGELSWPEETTILQIHSNDRLAIAWGGIVSQKAGQPRDTDIGQDESHWLVFVNSGTLRVTVDGKPIEITQGNVLLVLPHEICLGKGVDEAAAQWQWLAFRVKRSRRGSRQVCAEVQRVTLAHKPERIAELFRIIAEEFHEHLAHTPDESPMNLPSSHYLMMSLLVRLAPSHPLKYSPSCAANVLAEKAKDYIRINLDRAISTSDMARELDCTRGYLCMAFRKTYGETPIDCLLRTRLIIAARFLIDTRKSIGQIAQEVGFSNLNYFSRVFRRRYGITPSAYRRANSRLYVTADI